MDRRLALQGFAAAALAGAAPLARAAEPSAGLGALTVDSIADAWLAAVAIIEMAAARTRMTDPASKGQHAKLNAFNHTRNLVGPMDRTITTPNNDTIYSNSFVDMTKGPVLLTVPDVGSRYLSVAVMDFYTNNNVVLGARTPGGAAGTYALLAPGQTAPKGVRPLHIATPNAWVLARTLVNTPADLPAARKVQDSLILKGPAVGPYPAYATRGDDWPTFFRSVDQLMAINPPPTKAGLAGFYALKARSPNFTREALGTDARIVDEGVAKALGFTKTGRGALPMAGGWSYSAADLGDFKDNFRYRGLVAVSGLAALPQSEAMYMRAAGDSGRALFTGDQTWKLSLPERLPVDSFWSLTMYEATPDGQFFLTENPIHRYAIGDRTPGLRVGPNGAVDIWIGRTDPGGDKTANWLPAPAKGPFMISLRAYLPRPELRDGRYRVPALVAV